MEKVTNELRVIEEKEAGMLKFTRELESSQNLYKSFLQSKRNKRSTKLTSIKIENS